MRASGYARAVNDWYVEDEKVVEGLLGVEKFTGLVWDPACGAGNIPKVLRRNGVDCIASDIVDRGFPFAAQRDFLAMSTDSLVTSIVSNPPYGIIEPWIEKCLTLTTDKVAIIARLALLEGKARKPLFQGRWPLARVWVSSRRVSMPPGGENVPRKGGTAAYAWFIFENGHIGPPVIGWI